MDSSSPNLSSFDYKEYYSLYVIDVSYQSDSIKGQVTDITVEINFNSNITKPLQVYAVVISERIFETESDGSKFRVFNKFIFKQWSLNSNIVIIKSKLNII